VASPSARRLQRPRWRDGRLLTGLVLILASVALGGHLIGSASKTTGWLSAARPLAAGHVLVAGDLKTVQAHLPAAASGRYFTSAPGSLVGKTLATPVQAGELLAAGALAQPGVAESRIVPVVVRAGRVPALAAGDRVDVYVLTKPTSQPSAATATQGREVRVLTAAVFVSEDLLNSGDTSVQLRVSPGDAITAVAASQSGRVDLVRVDGSTEHQGDPGPSSIDGFGGS
jgi:hypothetical protein